MLKRIAGWRGKLLSYAAKVVLIKACLTSIPIYLMSFIKFPKWAIRIINTHLANCLWNDNAEAHKIHLVKWDSVKIWRSRDTKFKRLEYKLISILDLEIQRR